MRKRTKTNLKIIAAFLQIRTPILQFKRFRGKINIQRPRKPHYDRARLIAVTNPIFREQTIEEKCEAITIRTSVKNDNPYEKIIAREVKNWFDHSKVVAIFHLNSISQEDLFKTRVALHKYNIHHKAYGKSIMRQAVAGTQYEAILPLFNSKNCILFAPENSIKHILKVTKKVPQMILIAGILEDRLMSRNEIIEYSNMPDLQMMRAKFVSVLTSVGGGLVSNLESHQKNLVNILDTHVRICSTDEEAETKEETASETSETPALTTDTETK